MFDPSSTFFIIYINDLPLASNLFKIIIYVDDRTFKQRIRKFIDNIYIDCVDEFNFLCIIIHKHLTWNSHTNMIASQISSTIGTLNKLKHQFSLNIFKMIYNSLIIALTLRYSIVGLQSQTNRYSTKKSH